MPTRPSCRPRARTTRSSSATTGPPPCASTPCRSAASSHWWCPVPETTRRTYPGLDTVRALAALAVLATHTSFWAGFYPQGLLGAMTARLDIGVAVFFVLSGFLLGQPFLAATADGTTPPRAGRYLWKRFLRIVPLYVVTVVVALLALPENDAAGPSTWIRQLTLTQVYPPADLVAGLTHMWSLCVEVAFYLALPLLLWPLHRWSARRGWNPRTVLL
ncbi:MAG: acyltransferase, partial [Microbacterium sp.]